MNEYQSNRCRLQQSIISFSCMQIKGTIHTNTYQSSSFLDLNYEEKHPYMCYYYTWRSAKRDCPLVAKTDTYVKTLTCFSVLTVIIQQLWPWRLTTHSKLIITPLYGREDAISKKTCIYLTIHVVRLSTIVQNNNTITELSK